MTTCGRTNDGGSETIVSSQFAEMAQLNEMKKVRRVNNVVRQVELKDGDDAQSFRIGTPVPPPYHTFTCGLTTVTA